MHRTRFDSTYVTMLAITTLLLAACGQVSSADRQPIVAHNGVLDLRTWDFERDGALTLSGEWEFYWGQLLQAEDFTLSHPPAMTGLMKLPSSWNGYNVDGRTLSGDGYATYRLIIQLNRARLPLAVKLPEFETAYRLYANGQLISTNGLVGVTAQSMRPQWLPKVADFSSDTDHVDLILHVSNFYHRKGGAGQIIWLGLEPQIRTMRARALNLEQFLFGSLTIMGFYHAGLFGLRRKDKSALYFSLCCFLMALRIWVTGEHYLVDLIPNLAWVWVVRFNYLAFGFTVPLFVMFTCVLFPDEIPTWFTRLAWGATVLYAGIVLSTPAKIFTHALVPYQITALAISAYFIYSIGQAVAHRREGSSVLLAGFLVMVASMVNDILYYNQWIHTAYIVPVGVFAFTLTQAFLLAQRFAKAFVQVETLSVELEQRVVERTRQLEGANRDLKQEVAERQRAQADLLQAKEEAERNASDAQAANKAKSVFLANMSHELRTPLNAILGFTQLMTRDPNLTQAQRDNLVTINRSGEHLLTLINDVLDMSKIEAGRMTLQEQTFNLNRLLGDLENMFRARAEEKGLELAFKVAAGLPRSIYTDQGKLRQVLINLLSNAVKFTSQGRIVLRVASGGHAERHGEGTASPSASEWVGNPGAGPLIRLHFEVEDTGAGIPLEEQEAIFSPFVQSGEQKAYQGTGLGLAISRQFVNLMGGELSVSSPPDRTNPLPANFQGGPGSLFRFDICARPAQTGQLQAMQAVSSLLRIAGLAAGQPVYRLLVVEDQDMNRRLLVNLLTDLGTPGFEVRQASNGQEALEVWQSWQPHLIWMDMRMPVMDGHEATRRIKLTPQGQATIVIALTAEAFEEERAVILAEGCDDFIRKPFREADIAAVLSKHLGVQFEYETLEPDSRSGDGALLPNLATETGGIPLVWLKAMRQATLEGDLVWIEKLIEQMRASNVALADELAELARKFEHGQILTLVEQAALHPQPALSLLQRMPPGEK